MNFQLMNDTKIDRDSEVVKQLYIKPQITLLSTVSTGGKPVMRTAEVMYGSMITSRVFGPS